MAPLSVLREGEPSLLRGLPSNQPPGSRRTAAVRPCIGAGAGFPRPGSVDAGIDQDTAMKETASHSDGGRTAFDSKTQTRMGQQLRVMYREVMNQGVPDCHHELVERLGGVAATAPDE